MFVPLAVAQQIPSVSAVQRQSGTRRQRSGTSGQAPHPQTVVVAGGRGTRRSGLASSERQEVLFSMIGLSIKLGSALLACLSLVHLSGAYQQRLDQHGELRAILDIEQAKLRKAQERFDQLFVTDGEQRLIREQDQWIAPNRLRIVWNEPRSRTSQELISADPTPLKAVR